MCIISGERVLRASQKGFTLLEVLLSGFILFLVLASMTLVYRGALLSSAKAERSLKVSAAVPSIRILITDDFRVRSKTRDHRGAGRYGGLDYKWVATLTHSGQPSRIVQEDVGRPLRYFLWDVKLTITLGNMVRNYQFREVSW